jgi:16S rRNA (guanine966-N2)-methyltransferase
LRISSGDARGIRLKVPKGVRPASEKVRQAIFSSIAARVPDARVLDLYAGSGAYGLEAVSRGASSAVLVDNAADAIATMKANAKAAGMEADVTVTRSPVERFVERSEATFDLVFIDPPYDAAIERVLEGAARLLAPSGSIVLERRWRDEAPPGAEGLVVEADRRYGDTRVLVLIRGAPKP